jgi:hypothetical protein
MKNDCEIEIKNVWRISSQTKIFNMEKKALINLNYAAKALDEFC